MAVFAVPHSWLAGLVLLLVLGWTFGLMLALLNKILASPQRDVSVRVRLLPWPRFEIDVRNNSVDDR
ncbi:MAG TPA: hypothetical protein VHW44_18090 [Pseudonocardiaceae bacterium]|nr:hypothetical protein [Pseudonocardiaceae bacterium]